MTKVVKGYRFVTEDLCSKHGDVQWRVGEWQHCGGILKMCSNGFHASKEPIDSLRYVFGTRWFTVEAKDKILYDNDKFCASDMRLVREIPVNVIKRFGVACAKHVLPIYEAKNPDDVRPRRAIEATEDFLSGKITEKELGKAAYAAAEAAWAAAAAARAAAAEAAWAAAAAAARAAAAAAWAADDAADERKWQDKTLKRLIREAS